MSDSPSNASDNRLGFLIRRVFDMNERLVADQRSLIDEHRRVLAEHAEIKAKVDALSAHRKEGPRSTYIEDIPGKRVPYIYSADITLAAGVTARTQGTMTISQDGPFVVDALAATWRINAAGSAFNGRQLPISSADPNYVGTPQTAAGVIAGNIFDELIDFEWEVFDAGSDRAWQNIPAASRQLFTSRENPLHLPTSGFFERNSVISVFITPTRAIDQTGILKFSFHGYKVLLPIDYRP